MKKRIAAIFLIIGIIAGTISSCGRAPGNHVTRGEWIAMLADGFGLNDSKNAEPYYKDVTAQHDLFPAVQSLGDWDILAPLAGDTLGVDKSVTGREVAATAAVAAGFSGADVDAAVAYAQQYGIISEKIPEQMTAEECANALEAAKAVYVENPGEDKRVAVFAEGVVDLRTLGPEWISVEAERLTVHTAATFDGSTATLTVDGQPTNISVGSVVLVTERGPRSAEQAYKITEIREEGGQVTLLTTQPGFSEIYDQLDVHTTVSLNDGGYIVWEPGVTVTQTAPSELSATGQSYHVELLANQPKELMPKTENDNDIHETWGFEFGDGVTLLHNGVSSPVLGNSAQAKLFKGSSFDYTGTPSLADFKDSPEGFVWDLKREKKYDSGYKLTGDISFDLSATTDVDYAKLNIFNNEINLWPEKASVSLESNTTVHLKYEGDWSEDIKLATITIPIPGTGLSVKGSLFLCAGISGAIEVKLVLEDTARAEWAIGSGYRSGEGTHTATSEVAGAVDLSVGGKIAADLCAFDIKIIGAELKAEGVLEAEGKQVGECEAVTVDGAPARHYTEKLQLSASIYLPIVSLTVSGPDHISELFGLEKTFVLIDKDVERSIPVFSQDWVIWEATVGDDGQILEEEFPGLKVDLSSYVGVYQPFPVMEGEIITPLTLAENGSITGEAGYAWPGGSFSDPLEGSGIAPIEMLENDDGSITCTINDEWETIYEEDGNYYSTGNSVTYTIYPPGVPTGDIRTVSLDNTTRIYYQYAGGGVDYHWYYQPQQAEQAAATFDELWNKLDGTWQFEEYQQRGKSVRYPDHTVKLGYDGDTACIDREADLDDKMSMRDTLLYELVPIDAQHYNAYTYKHGFYETESDNWDNDVQSAWYSFDLSNLENGELILGYHVMFHSGSEDSDSVFRYRLIKD